MDLRNTYYSMYNDNKTNNSTTTQNFKITNRSGNNFFRSNTKMNNPTRNNIFPSINRANIRSNNTKNNLSDIELTTLKSKIDLLFV